MTDAALILMPGTVREQPPLSLYIHFPWCVRKCPYCDFNSHEVRDAIDDTAYVSALLTDLELALPQIWGRLVHTIFIGGGTPSLLSVAAVDQLLSGIRARVRLDPAVEVTLEVNPGTVETEKFLGFYQAGVNRLSLGVQSFDRKKLSVLGRIHDDIQARRAVEVAQSYFDNVNVDLMYALPAQTLHEALNDIEIALSYGVAHLSAYHLTIEPNTLFYRYTPANLPNEEIAADMQDAIEERMAQAGFVRYETSAFARSSFRCRHNLNYWQFGDYLGIGAGAHSKISSFRGIVREMRFKQPNAYLNAVAQRKPIQSQGQISRCELPFEFMMNALRLAEGFDLGLFVERTGLPVSVVDETLQLAIERGLIVQEGTIIRPSLRGHHFLNDLLTLFLKK